MHVHPEMDRKMGGKIRHTSDHHEGLLFLDFLLMTSQGFRNDWVSRYVCATQNVLIGDVDFVTRVRVHESCEIGHQETADCLRRIRTVFHTCQTAESLIVTYTASGSKVQSFAADDRRTRSPLTQDVGKIIL